MPWCPRPEHAQHPLVVFCLQVVLGLKLEYLDAVGREQLTATELLEFWAQAALLPDHDVLVRRMAVLLVFMLAAFTSGANAQRFLACSKANVLLLMQCAACS